MDMDGTSSFGYWLRRRRKALDLTQYELARQAGCALDTIKKIETDARRPSRQLAERLAMCLQLPTEQHAAFLQAARAERSADHLSIPTQPFDSIAPDQPALSASLTLEAAHTAGERPIFVGRERELTSLAMHLEAALTGDGRVVFVTGEAGDGKTALLAEFARRAQERHADLLVASGACNAYAGMGDPYVPFRDVLGMLSGDIASRRSAWALTIEQMQRLWAASPQVVQELAEQANDLIDVLVSSTALARRTAALGSAGDQLAARLRELARRGRGAAPLEQRQLFEQYTHVLRAVGARHPLLILLDDLQWADAASINLLFHLGRRIAGSRVMILGAYRLSEVALGRTTTTDERTHPLKPVVNELTRHFGDRPIDLGDVTPAEGRQFVDALLDITPNRLAETFRAAMFRHTHGQPLFTVEMLRMMRERGDLTLDGEGRWTERPTLAWDTLPVRVEAVIKQRVERLDDVLRQILTIASVEGEEFTTQIVARIQGIGEREALRLISHELDQRHSIVRERGEMLAGDLRVSRYQFSHALFQHYLYNRLSAGERRLLHGELARALEALYAGHTGTIAVQLAHHYTQAGESEHAITYLLQAGDGARTVYALKEAATHYERALGLLKARGDYAQSARTLMKLGLAYHLDFDFERSRQAYTEGFALWQQLREATTAPDLPPAPHPFRLIWDDPPSLDPTMGGYNQTAPILTQMFSGLVAQSPEMEVVPDVAQSWEVLDAGRTYIFHLRDDVYWSDGMPVTATDFEFTFKRALDPALAAPVAASLLYGITGAKAFHQGQTHDAASVGVYAPDPATLVIELEEPASYLLNDLSYYVLLPVPRHAVLMYGSAWTNPEHIVTNGPFRLAAWRRGDSMVLERNLAYHGSFSGNLQRVELTLGIDSATQFELYETDRLDLVYNWFFSAHEIDRLRWRHPDEYSVKPRFALIYLCFDVSRPPFDDRRVRQAFAMAIDKAGLANVVLKGYELPATGGLVPPGMPGHVPEAGLPYDPARARRLLAEAGYGEHKDLPPIPLIVYWMRQAAAGYVQVQWHEHLGVGSRWKS